MQTSAHIVVVLRFGRSGLLERRASRRERCAVRSGLFDWRLTYLTRYAESRCERLVLSGEMWAIALSLSAFAHLCQLAANFSFLDSLSRVRCVHGESKRRDLTAHAWHLKALRCEPLTVPQAPDRTARQAVRRSTHRTASAGESSRHCETGRPSRREFLRRAPGSP